MICRTTALWSVALALGLLWPAIAAAKTEKRIVEDAKDVLDEFLDLKIKGIPASLLAEAHGVAIIPDVIKVGLVVGGQRGKGVVVIRDKDGSWRAPTFVTITGGSIGWQAGAQSSDIVLVFKTQKSVDGLMQGKFTIGADAAAAAGPVGRRVEAATDAQLKAEIYSYSRSRGLFAGVSIDGSVLHIDNESNAVYYGGDNREPPKAAIELMERIAKAIDEAAATAGPVAVGPIGGPMDTPAAGPGQVIEALPAPSNGPTLAPPAAVTLEGATQIRPELARAWGQLSALVDDRWRQYLALPGELLRDGPPPSAESLKGILARYDSTAINPQYRALAERSEFQATQDLLRAYLDALAPAGPKIALPPPPDGPR